MRWAPASASLRARPSKRLAIWRRYSRTSRRAIFCSSTKFTGSTARSKKFSIPRWKTTRSISSSERGRLQTPSGSICRALPSSAQRPEPGSFPAPCATVSACSCVWSCTPQKNCSALSCVRPRCWALRSSPPARGRSRPVRAGRRVSRTACCAACAISRRSATTA